MGNGGDKKIKVSENEIKCLAVLVNYYHCDGNCTYFRHIANVNNMDEKKVRRYVRSLARKGLAEYTRGLFDSDGMVAGSGYCATQAGWDWYTENIDKDPDTACW